MVGTPQVPPTYPARSLQSDTERLKSLLRDLQKATPAPRALVVTTSAVRFPAYRLKSCLRHRTTEVVTTRPAKSNANPTSGRSNRFSGSVPSLTTEVVTTTLRDSHVASAAPIHALTLTQANPAAPGPICVPITGVTSTSTGSFPSGKRCLARSRSSLSFSGALV